MPSKSWSRSIEIGVALALASAAALAAAGYLWANAYDTEGAALSLIGLAGILGAAPLLFGWSSKELARGLDAGCHSCGFVTPAGWNLNFCLMCGNFPKTSARRA